MQQGYHVFGGAPHLKKLKAGASVVNPGIPLINGVAGVIPCTTTDFNDTPGLGLDTCVYSTVQGVGEALVTVDVRSDLAIKARMSGAATDGTALGVLSNTVASTAGTVITDADVGTASSATGTVWCTKGANVGQSRTITTFTSGVSITVTVPFLNDIAVGDEFLWCPYNNCAAGAGQGHVQATTLFTEANAIIVAGTGLLATVIDLELNGALNSYVLFKAGDHILDIGTV